MRFRAIYVPEQANDAINAGTQGNDAPQAAFVPRNITPAQRNIADR